MEQNCAALIRAFQNPDLDYEPVMMWFWNDEVTEERITWQMEKFRQQNITNFFIHPALGFPIEYLSDRYMELIQYVVKEAKRLGMYYWIYDEYEFPSGTAGGILCRDYPQYRQKEVRVEDHKLNGPGHRISLCRPGDLLCAQLITELGDRTYVQDITGQCRLIRQGEFTQLEYIYTETNIGGRALFFFSEYNLQLLPSGTGRAGADNILGYVDMFNPAAVGKFIELTHERYKQFIGDEFGKTVRGVFTDEPTSLRHFDYTTTGPWSDTFDEEFRKDHGYSLIPWLYTLWTIPAKTPEEIRAVHDYRSTVKRLYFDAFMKPYSRWCRENGLIFTGHFGGEEEVGAHVAQGDMLEELMLFDMPGMDSIYSSIKINWISHDTAPQLARSAAKFCGSNRVICETYTGSGWNMRLPVMQRCANRLLVQGINWIQYMGAHYSMGGAAKTYCGALPPNHSFINTLYPQYRDLGGYFASFCALSAATVQDSHALLFIPIMQREQEYYRYQENKWDGITILDQEANRSYVDTVLALLYEGISYDLFSENLTDAITVHDGYVEAYGYRYNALIFPRMYYINAKTRTLLEELKKHNVTTVFTHMMPGVNVDTGEHFDHGYDLKPFLPAAHVSSDGCTYFIEPPAFPLDLDLYRTALQKTVGGKVLNISADTGVYICKRTNPEAEVYFVFNDNAVPAAVAIDALPGMYLLTHKTSADVPYTVQNGRMSFTLSGYEMIAIVRDPASTEMPVSTVKEVPDRTVQLGEPDSFRPADGNYLPLTYEMYNPLTGQWDACKYMCFSEQVHLPKNGPYKLRAKVQIDHLPESVLLNAEIQRVTRLAVNGTELEYGCNCIRWSMGDFTTEIAQLLHVGENLFEIEGYTENIAKPNVPPYVYLSGEFRLDAQERMIAPAETIPFGGWESHGYYYYSGDGIYTFRVTPEKGFRKVTLTTHTDDAAKIYVNGQYAGQKLWLADETDLTPFLCEGENEIEVRVTSTRANQFACSIGMYGGFRTENGILQPMELHYYR